MPAKRRQGMDHEHHEWSPISTRGKLNWPNNARVALCVIVTLEHAEWEPPEGSFSADQAGGLGLRPFPDYPRFSHREYGHRVGIFRVLDTLERLGIKATVAMDAQTAEGYPYLVKHCLDRGCEIIAHGVSGSQMISGDMSIEEEADFIRSSMDAMKKATGSAPRGWFGTDYGESERTPDLLRKAGIDYLCDWVNDEQPYPMADGLVALPTMLEMDDVFAMSNRRVEIERYAQSLKDCFDIMYQDGEDNGRLLAINLHPWLVGQPFRIGYLEEALAHIMGHDGVWSASGSEIIDWFNNNPPA
ncbi:MAG: polysaccharide deacetylase family protein [Chloroflexi bacterium]|nr:polysaccharide deacetylase family protein [Chloroflexota bacterium]